MIFGPNYKEVDIKGYEGLYKISNKGDVISLSKIRGFLKLKELRGDKLKITNIETEEIIIANSKREAANIINGADAGIIYAIKNNSIYKHKYKIKVLSYGCK